MASEVSRSAQFASSDSPHPLQTPARNRRLSNFHRVGSHMKPTPGTANRRTGTFHPSGTSPSSRRTPLRPFHGQTPARTPHRQSFAPLLMKTSPRSAPNSKDGPGPRSRHPQLSKAEIAHMYSSTIKLCQDNKINARNTWTLNLIDYMGMLVKGDEGADNVSRTVSFQDDVEDASAEEPTAITDTNFQLAGVTLDAGVKIYCSRVDSVHTNAFKVLGGLSRTANQDATTAEEDEADEAGADNVNTKRKRNAKRSGRSTLETNLGNITSQKLETDLAVDPLFLKMSAAFDEGGARGMLMNNLPVGPRGQVIFDSGEPADNLVSVDTGRKDEETHADRQTAKVYDVSSLIPAESMSDKDTICGSFLRFYKAKKLTMSSNSAATEADRNGVSRSAEKGLASAKSEDSGALGHDQDLGFDYDSGDLQTAGDLGVFSSSDPGRDSSIGQDDDEVNVFVGEDDPGRFSMGSNVSIVADAQRGGLDLVEAGVALQEDSSYAFFDTASLSCWAGPQHWRFRATEASSSSSSDKGRRDTGKKAKRPRGKTAMLLDFYSEAPKVGFAKEFAPGKNESSHHLSLNVREGLSEKKVTLPEDLHYSPPSLSGLFLKPNTYAKPKGGIKNIDNVQSKPGDGDGAGWYDFENDCDNENFCPGGGDDLFEAEPENAAAMSDNEEELGMALVSEPTRVEKIDINYAKVAKKVDVRQLKSGLWSKLCGDGEVSCTSEEKDPSGASSKSGERIEGSESDVRAGSSQRLQQIVSDMPSFVPAESLPDVSLPYVFICLLHLANEKTLRLAQADDGSLQDLIITSGEGDTC